jgi:hypothetical protein
MTQQTKHLDNVLIMQKHMDSERVLECRKEFQESEQFIVKAVNMHEELTNLLYVIKISLESGDTTNLINHINETLQKAGQ